MRFIFKILISTLSLSCSKARPSDKPLERAPHISLDRVEGSWNILARIPTYLDRDATNMTMQFSNPSVKSIELDWNFEGTKGEDKTFHFTAVSGEGTASTAWSVSPLWPIRLHFEVSDLSADYSWIVIASRDRRYMWLLSRLPRLDANLIGGIIDHLAAKDFDKSAIVIQNPATVAKAAPTSSQEPLK